MSEMTKAQQVAAVLFRTWKQRSDDMGSLQADWDRMDDFEREFALMQARAVMRVLGISDGA